VRALLLRSAEGCQGVCPALTENVPDVLGEERVTAADIIQQTEQFWSAMKEAPEWNQLMKFADSVHPLVQALIRVASRLEVSGLHAATKHFEASLDPLGKYPDRVDDSGSLAAKGEQNVQPKCVANVNVKEYRLRW